MRKELKKQLAAKVEFLEKELKNVKRGVAA